MDRAFRVALAATLLAAGISPAAASAGAREPQRLFDLAPQQTATFRDYVGPSTQTRARAAGDSPTVAYTAKDGIRVRVRFSGSYNPDAGVAQSYVDFLDSLPHGSELGLLKVLIATPSEVQADCGGADGTLACYNGADETMTVPGEQTADDGSGITTSYVIAHEYGHHIARNRSNAPFPALAFGPKYWASEEMVCLRTIKGLLAPGDEGSHYLDNPGESWADTYAHLSYPKVAWQFTDLLRPTTASEDAALRDVQSRWTRPVVRVFRGRLRSRGARMTHVTFPLRLDGSITVRLHGPQGSDFDLAISSDGRRIARTSGHGSRDVYSTRYACRDRAVEHVKLTVVRRSGSGPFSLRVSYAG